MFARKAHRLSFTTASFAKVNTYPKFTKRYYSNVHGSSSNAYIAYIVEFNPLSGNSTKWSNTLTQFIGKLPTNCLTVFDHFVGLALKGLKRHLPIGRKFYNKRRKLTSSLSLESSVASSSSSLSSLSLPLELSFRLALRFLLFFLCFRLFLCFLCLFRLCFFFFFFLRSFSSSSSSDVLLESSSSSSSETCL